MPEIPPIRFAMLGTGVVAEYYRQAIEAHADLLHELDGAPDPNKEPKKYEKWLARRNLRAFKVNVEVIDYRHDLEQLPAPRKGQRLTVSIDLKTFGETIPGRVMAFSGEGSATVKLDIGKRLRKRDSEVGKHDAIELSIDKALAESIRKLRMPPPAKPGIVDSALRSTRSLVPRFGLSPAAAAACRRPGHGPTCPTPTSPARRWAGPAADRAAARSGG